MHSNILSTHKHTHNVPTKLHPYKPHCFVWVPLATPPAAELHAQEGVTWGYKDGLQPETLAERTGTKTNAVFLPTYTPTSHAALCVNASSHTPCC